MGKWQVTEIDPQKIEEIAQFYNVDHILARCILNRRLKKPGEMACFLEPESYTPPDPFLMPGMEAAVNRILEAIDGNERICIYGDYDADGVTAISILTQGLRELGGDVFYYIPDRFFEGVGLHSERLAILQNEERVKLIITVDTGACAFDEMVAANEMGLDVIITDHHTPDDRCPNALALLNPKLAGSQYPFKGLCGAGVALKVIQGLDQRHPHTLDMEKYIQIAAVGTIADMVPLREENRWIVNRGLKAMENNERSPLRSLLRKVGIRGSATALDISFKVAPRINAPGRLGDPDTSIRFLQSSDPLETAQLVDIMDGMNSLRQMLEKELEEKLEVQIKHSFRGSIPPFVLLAGRHWHRGILGILACKLLRRFNRPACIISFDETTAYGSIRSVSGVNVLDPLRKISSLLTNFGGHPEAAGVTLPLTNLPLFKQRMIELLAPDIQDRSGEGRFVIDLEIDWKDLTNSLFEKLRRMAPYGIGNAAPIFLSPNLILESELLRKGPWYHFTVSDGNITRRCSFYHPIDLATHFERFDSVDLVFSLAPFRNEYQIQIVEMRQSQADYS